MSDSSSTSLEGRAGKRLKSILVVGATTVLVVGVASSGAHADQSSSEASNQTETQSDTDVALVAERAGISPAELEDLTFFAEQEGVPVEQMIEGFAGQSAFAAALHVFQVTHPDGFVYASWGQGEGHIVVRPGFREVADSIFRANGAKYSITESDLLTEKEQSALAYEVMLALPSIPGGQVGVRVDPLTGVVRVEIVAQHVSSDAEAGLEQVRSDLRARGIDLELVVWTG